MSTVADLIRKASGSGVRAQAARLVLSSKGVDIVPELLSLIRGSAGKRLHLIREMLLKISDPEVVPLVAESLKSRDFDVWKIAFDVLSNPNFKSGFEPLLVQLTDFKNLETKRAQAATAIGDLGDPRAIDPLFGTAVKAFDSGLYLLTVSISVALAKLGRHDIAPITTFLAQKSDDATIQVHAVAALKYLVTPDILKTLAVTLKDHDDEICKNSIDGLFFLGTSEAIHLLIERVQTADTVIWPHIRRRHEDLTGASCPERPEDLVVWWRGAKASFRSGICYRLGEPIWLPNVFGQFEKEPKRWESLLEEIYIITGQRFGIHPRLTPSDADVLKLSRKVGKWWEQHSAAFEKGALYKFGFQQAIPQGT